MVRRGRQFRPLPLDSEVIYKNKNSLYIHFFNQMEPLAQNPTRWRQLKKVTLLRRLTFKRKNVNNIFFGARVIFGEVDNLLLIKSFSSYTWHQCPWWCSQEFPQIPSLRTVVEMDSFQLCLFRYVQILAFHKSIGSQNGLSVGGSTNNTNKI